MKTAAIWKTYLLMATRACVAMVLMLGLQSAYAKGLVLENDLVRVEVNKKTGSFSAKEKQTGYLWREDPWEQSAAVLTIKGDNGKDEEVNLSNSQEVVVRKSGNLVNISFKNPVRQNGSVMEGALVEASLSLQDDPRST